MSEPASAEQLSWAEQLMGRYQFKEITKANDPVNCYSSNVSADVAWDEEGMAHLTEQERIERVQEYVRSEIAERIAVMIEILESSGIKADMNEALKIVFAENPEGADLEYLSSVSRAICRSVLIGVFSVEFGQDLANELESYLTLGDYREAEREELHAIKNIYDSLSSGKITPEKLLKCLRAFRGFEKFINLGFGWKEKYEKVFNTLAAIEDETKFQAIVNHIKDMTPTITGDDLEEGLNTETLKAALRALEKGGIEGLKKYETKELGWK